MRYWTLLGTCISLYVLLNFIALPELKRRWVAARSLAKISKAGLLAGLTTLRNIALVASITYSLFALLVLILGGVNGDVRLLSWVIARAASLHDQLGAVKAVVEAWLFVIPVALLVYLAWRRMRQDLRDRFEDRVLEELDRLNRERAADPAAWASTATPAHIEEIDREIAELSAGLSGTDKRDRDGRARAARTLALLRARRRTAEYEARVNLDPLHEALDDPPQTGWRRWRGFFLSRGFLADTKRSTKILSRAALAALALALIGVGTEAGLADEISDRIASLDDLRIERTKEHAPRGFAPEAADQPALTGDDARAVQHLSQQFSRALANNRHWRGIRPALVLDRELELQLARRAVLNQTVLPAPDGTTTKRAASAISDLPRAEQQVVDDLAGAASRGDTKLGERIAQRQGRGIVRWFGSQWGETRKAILDHAALYRQPAGPADVQSALLDRVLSAIVDEAIPDAGGELGKQARGALSSASKAALNEGVELQLRAVLADLEARVPFDEAINRVRTRPISVAVRHVDGVAGLLHEHWSRTDIAGKIAPNQTRWDPPDRATPSGANSGGSGVDLDAWARSITRDGAASLPEDAFEGLAEYEDHFPRTVSSQQSTALGQIVQRHLRPADRQFFQQLAQTRVARAHSFTMLRGFSRVGGVLIGIDPENPADQLDLTDLTWSTSDRRLTLTFTTSGGKRISMGPYDPGLVHQALAYAADGRPVAVTMTTARPLPQLKIHLHPALVDSPLGCHVITLDRLVDTYAGRQLARREELTTRAIEEEQVYRLAWASRARVLTDGLAARRLSPDDRAYVEARRRAAAGIIEDAKRQRGTSQALEHAVSADGARIYDRKPEFFDPALVESIKACAGQREPAAFDGCVGTRFANRVDDKAVGGWLTAPASFSPWSGVRERPFRVDGALAFARNEGAGDPLLDPFRFMVQLAFTSVAVNAPDPNSYVDTNPLEFTEIEDSIHKLVRAGVVEHRQAGMLADLQRFALLQRLFRVLLSRQGGDRFPVRKLADLGAATAGSVPYVHTRRWNGSLSSSNPKLRDLEATFGVLEDEALEKRSSCSQLTPVPAAR